MEWLEFIKFIVLAGIAGFIVRFFNSKYGNFTWVGRTWPLLLGVSLLIFVVTFATGLAQPKFGYGDKWFTVSAILFFIAIVVFIGNTKKKLP